MFKLSKEQRLISGSVVAVIAILLFLCSYFFLERTNNQPIPIGDWHPWLQFALLVMLLITISLIFSFRGILFDNEEYKANTDKKGIVKKIRYRGVLFNNIAIILFLMTMAVIIASFYLLVNPPIHGADNEKNIATNLTVRIGASVILIFLVQILFKVFKYLLRVAAFYNARADAIEFESFYPNELKEGKLPLDKLMDVFTPEKYDISELDKVSVLDGIADALKSK